MSFVVMIQESLPYRWFRRECFHGQKIILFQWLLIGSLVRTQIIL